MVNNQEEMKFVIHSDGYKVLVRNLTPIEIKNLKFSAGFWRVQDEFKKETKIIRDKEFVVYEKMDITEPNNFTYYHAREVNNSPDLAYGKYETGIECYLANYDKYWAYGETTAKAGAFLANKLFKLFRDDLIYPKIKENNKGQKNAR